MATRRGSKNAKTVVTADQYFFPSQAPDVVGLSRLEAIQALIDSGIDYLIVYSGNGATAENNDIVFDQVNDGISTIYVYQYSAPTGFAIHSIRYNMGMMNGPFDIYIDSVENIPSVGDIIVVSGNESAAFNTSWLIKSVADENSIVSNGTKMTASALYGSMNMDTSMNYLAGGTYVILPHENPSFIEFVPSSNPFDIRVLYKETGSNSMSGTGFFFLRVPLNSGNAQKMLYGPNSPASNGWSGATLNFIPDPDYSSMFDTDISGEKTIVSSEVTDEFGPASPASIKLKFEYSYGDPNSASIEFEFVGRVNISNLN